MSLFVWELKKIFMQKSLYIVAILLFGWFTLIAFTNVNHSGALKEEFQKWEGPITDSKLAQAEKIRAEMEAKQEPTAEEYLKAGVAEELALSQLIQSNNRERKSSLQTLIKDAYADDDVALGNKLQKQVDMYDQVKIDKISYYAGPREAVDFVNVFGLILTGVFLLIGLAGVYSNEQSTGVENYILSAKNRVNTMRAKVGAAVTYAVVVVFCWEGFNLGTKFIIYGGKGWDLPIQYSFKYFNSPYHLTFMEYHLIQLGVHLAAAIAFAVVIVVVSTLAKRTVLSLFISGALFGVPVVAQSIMDLELNWIDQVLRYSLTNVMKVEDLFMNFISINVFGFPLLAPYVGLMVSLSVLLIGATLSIQLIKRKQVA